MCISVFYSQSQLGEESYFDSVPSSNVWSTIHPSTIIAPILLTSHLRRQCCLLEHQTSTSDRIHLAQPSTPVCSCTSATLDSVPSSNIDLLPFDCVWQTPPLFNFCQCLLDMWTQHLYMHFSRSGTVCSRLLSNLHCSRHPYFTSWHLLGPLFSSPRLHLRCTVSQARLTVDTFSQSMIKTAV